jgi:hypothetical protein
MTEENIVQKIKIWKPVSKRPTRRPRKFTFLGDVKSLNVNNRNKAAPDRDRWKEVVKRARTLYML